MSIYSKKIRIIMLMHSVIYITMIVMECNEIAYLITFSYLTQVTMLIIEKICREYVEKLEKY
jgi:accessory gene regulator B